MDLFLGEIGQATEVLLICDRRGISAADLARSSKPGLGKVDLDFA